MAERRSIAVLICRPGVGARTGTFSGPPSQGLRDVAILAAWLRDRPRTDTSRRASRSAPTHSPTKRRRGSSPDLLSARGTTAPARCSPSWGSAHRLIASTRRPPAASPGSPVHRWSEYGQPRSGHLVPMRPTSGDVGCLSGCSICSGPNGDARVHSAFRNPLIIAAGGTFRSSQPVLCTAWLWSTTAHVVGSHSDGWATAWREQAVSAT